MSHSTESFGVSPRRVAVMEAGWAALRHALGWPGRVYRARQLLHQLGGLADHELRDIGLTRLDLGAVSALSLDADPSVALRRCAEERRRR